MTGEERLKDVVGRLVSLCPPDEVSFNPPLTPAERVMLLACLADTKSDGLLSWLSVHNGANGSVHLSDGGRIEFFTSQEIASYFFARNAIAGLGNADYIEGPVRPELSFKRRIPFADLNDLPVCIDCDPPVEGRVGQVVLVDVEQGALWVLNSSITEFFEEAVSRLQKRRAGLG